MKSSTIKYQPQITGYDPEKAMSYEEYQSLLEELVNNEATTGQEQLPSLVNYTMLNLRRHKRWHKTLKIDPHDLKPLKGKLLPRMSWIVLTESWCGDAAHLMPVMYELAKLIGNIDIKVLLRDENPALMDRYLTDGSRSIPKLIAIGKDSKEELFVYGPRPSEATRMADVFKSEHGSLTPEFKEELQHWYNKDKGQTTIKDLVEKLRSL